MFTTFKELIKKHPIIISPFHPSTTHQTNAGLLSTLVGIDILIITDNKAELDKAVGRVIPDNLVKSYEIIATLINIPNILIIVDNVIKFQQFKLEQKFKNKTNNLIFLSDMNLQNENYKYIFDSFPNIKKVNINLLGNFPIIKIKKYQFTISDDLYTKYQKSDDRLWYNLSFYETDQLDTFSINSSSKIKLLLSKIVLDDNVKHLVYISPDIYQGVEKLSDLLNSLSINNCILENSDVYKNKEFKGVILTSSLPTEHDTIHVENINSVHFIGNVSYKVYGSWMEKLYRVKCYDCIIPEIEVNFYLTKFSEDGHVSPENHQFHFLEGELVNNIRLFFPENQQFDLCWKNGENFVYCASN